jgi:hypothetical protein
MIINIILLIGRVLSVLNIHVYLTILLILISSSSIIIASNDDSDYIFTGQVVNIDYSGYNDNYIILVDTIRLKPSDVGFFPIHSGDTIVVRDWGSLELFCDVDIGDSVEVCGWTTDNHYNTYNVLCGEYIKCITTPEPKTKPKPPRCSGTITGHVYDDATDDPIDDALVESGRISDDTNSRGRFSLDGDFCPNTRYTIECSADGYESDTKRVTTDDDGDGDVDFYLDPDCDGTISGYVRDATTQAPIKGALVEVESSGTLHVYSVNRNSDETSSSGRFSIDGNFCPNTRYTIKCSAEGYKLATRSITTERDGDKEVDIYLEPEPPACSGTVSGHVYDASTGRPISGASLLFCHGGDCWAIPVTDSWGLYASIGRHCPSSSYEVTCSADGYRLETKRATTDSLGNAALDFHLVPLCRGTISGRVYDSSTGRPIPGAALLFCQGGDCWCPPVTDSRGNYGSSDRFCPSSTCEITCSADGYKTVTKTITTDSGGNAAFNFILEPLCAGAVSGHVYDAVTGMPITGAALLICCQGGDCWCPPVTDSSGSYIVGNQASTLTTCEVVCSAEGYEPITKYINIDINGDSASIIYLNRQIILDSDRDDFVTDAKRRANNCLFLADWIESCSDEKYTTDEYKDIYQSYNIDALEDTREHITDKIYNKWGTSQEIIEDIKFIDRGVEKSKEFSYNAFNWWMAKNAYNELSGKSGDNYIRNDPVIGLLRELAELDEKEADLWQRGSSYEFRDEIYDIYCEQTNVISYIEDKVCVINPPNDVLVAICKICEIHKESIDRGHLYINGEAHSPDSPDLPNNTYYTHLEYTCGLCGSNDGHCHSCRWCHYHYRE